MRTIREARLAVKMSQAELARAIGANQVTVYNWERGESTPTAVMLRKVAKALGVSMDEIIFEPDQVKTAA